MQRTRIQIPADDEIKIEEQAQKTDEKGNKPELTGQP
jgi:hypothetical protein